MFSVQNVKDVPVRSTHFSKFVYLALGAQRRDCSWALRGIPAEGVAGEGPVAFRRRTLKPREKSLPIYE
jgi:hypothetical protein